MAPKGAISMFANTNLLRITTTEDAFVFWTSYSIFFLDVIDMIQNMPSSTPII